MTKRLTLAEERSWAHYRLTLTHVSTFLALWSVIFVGLAAVAVYRGHGPDDVLVPNYAMRIWYGWIATTCFAKEPEYPDGMISILRLLQLHALPHYLSRFAFLFGITVILVIGYCRMNRFLVKNPNPSWITRLVVEVQPVLHAVGIIYTSLILLFNQRVDKMEVDTYMLTMQRFFVFTLVHMILYAIQDQLDRSSSTGCSWRNKLRILCTVTLATTFYEVLQTLRPFIAVTACHPYVPRHSAYIEYACLLSIVVFYNSAIFDLGDMELVISVDRRELDGNDVYGDDYKPQYSAETKKNGGNKVFPTVSQCNGAISVGKTS